jgi:hypothetical protein
MSLTPLTVRAVEIKTATVEIKTLTVSNKQLTLSVFRQLLKSDPFDDNGALCGTLWGFVNYCPGDCPYTRPHTHIVWATADGGLYRHSHPFSPAYPSSDVEKKRWEHEDSVIFRTSFPQLFIAI